MPKGDLPMFPRLTSFDKRLSRLESSMARILAAFEGKSDKRRSDPEAVGIYPQTAGGVAVYLQGVGPKTPNRSRLYVGIARDLKAGKDLQGRALSLLEWASGHPEEVREILFYWSEKGRKAEPIESLSQMPTVSLPIEGEIGCEKNQEGEM